MASEEQVVLLDEGGSAIGEMRKSEVHSAETPLHLAFSCYLFNDAGEVLVTRRALAKQTWAGVWTNSFCGHPAPGEDFRDAITRRAQQELGAEVTEIRAVLPDFRYRAIDASGVVENEICPVYVARIVGDLQPSPAEVEEWAWIAPSNLQEAVVLAPFAFSPWLAEQLAEIAEHPHERERWKR